jgi:hypothetical protein
MAVLAKIKVKTPSTRKPVQKKPNIRMKSKKDYVRKNRNNKRYDD